MFIIEESLNHVNVLLYKSRLVTAIFNNIFSMYEENSKGETKTYRKHSRLKRHKRKKTNLIRKKTRGINEG